MLTSDQGTRKMSRRPRICYLCRKPESECAERLTNDHIIPDGFFPQPKPANLLTLPCCVPCQKEYRQHEEYVRNSFAASSNLSGNAEALQAWKAAHRSLKYRKAVYVDFLKRISPVEIGDRTLPGLGFSQERTEKVLRKIVLGLHYHHTGAMLPPDIPMTVYFQPQSILEDLIKYRKYVGRYGNTVSYAGAYAVEGDSVWWLSFYQSVLAIVTVDVTPVEAASEPNQTLKEEGEKL